METAKVCGCYSNWQRAIDFKNRLNHSLCFLLFCFCLRRVCRLFWNRARLMLSILWMDCYSFTLFSSFIHFFTFVYIYSTHQVQWLHSSVVNFKSLNYISILKFIKSAYLYASTFLDKIAHNSKILITPRSNFEMFWRPTIHSTYVHCLCDFLYNYEFNILN